MTTLAEHLAAARRRSAQVEREIELLRSSPTNGRPFEVSALRIKLVETERLIAILSDPDIADGYRKGRTDCARHLREEFGLHRPDDTPVLNLLRRIADRWEHA